MIIRKIILEDLAARTAALYFVPHVLQRLEDCEGWVLGGAGTVVLDEVSRGGFATIIIYIRGGHNARDIRLILFSILLK